MKETRRKLQEYFNKENNYEDNLTNISIESEQDQDDDERNDIIYQSQVPSIYELLNTKPEQQSLNQIQTPETDEDLIKYLQQDKEFITKQEQKPILESSQDILEQIISQQKILNMDIQRCSNLYNSKRDE